MADIKETIEQIKIGEKIYDIKDAAAQTSIIEMKTKLDGITWDPTTQTLTFTI